MKPSESIKNVKGLLWPELIPGTLIKRYKRFMANVKLTNGQVITAHCPNSGRMEACCEPGRMVYLSYRDVPKRKLKYTWELIEMPTSLVGVNTQVPNRLVFQSIQQGLIENLDRYSCISREVKINQQTRLDLLLSNGENDRCFVEIKNCTLVNDGVAFFPDAVTSRGQKHLHVLRDLKKTGFRCVIFFLIQRMDAEIFRPADHIDPAYGKELRRSVKAGVEMLVYDVYIDHKEIFLNHEVPYQL